MLYIYALIDSLNYQIRYVGQTNNPKIRLIWHLGHYKKIKSHKANWIKRLIKSGGSVKIAILETVEDKDVNEREKYWIKFGRDSGWNLTNLAEGGDGHTSGYKWTEEQKKKFSEKKKGVKFTEEHKLALSLAQKKRLETKSHVRSGLKHTEESKLKMSNTKTGKSINSDHDKRSNDRSSEWANPEIRKKRTESMRLKWQDPEYRKAQADARLKSRLKNKDI